MSYQQGIQTWLNTVSVHIMHSHDLRTLESFLKVYQVSIDLESIFSSDTFQNVPRVLMASEQFTEHQRN